MPNHLDAHPTAAAACRPRRFPVTATTRLKQAEAEQLRDAADRLDVTLSTLLRRLAVDYLRNSA